MNIFLLGYLIVHFLLVIFFYILIYDKNDILTFPEFLVHLILAPYLIIIVLYDIKKENKKNKK